MRRGYLAGGEDQHGAAGAGQPGDGGLRGGDVVVVELAVGDHDEQPHGAGGGEADEPVGFGDGVVEAVRVGVGAHVAHVGGASAGPHEDGDLVAEGDGGAGGADAGGGVGEDPRGRGQRRGERLHGAGYVDEDGDGQVRVGDGAAAGALPRLGGRDGAGGLLGGGGDRVTH